MRTIKDMPEHSRPREKLREKGAPALTDEELVAAILGRGMINIDVRTMARQVVNLVREHREKLALKHLTAIPGIKLANKEWGPIFDNPKSLPRKSSKTSKPPSNDSVDVVIFKWGRNNATVFILAAYPAKRKHVEIYIKTIGGLP